jgi:transposase-like protein
MAERKYGPEVIDRIVEQLEEGKSLVLICRDEGMPDRRTIYRWTEGDDELAERLYRARELGYHYRAEVAVAAAKNAKDPIAGRLAFDAERWYLGKLSIAFRDKPLVQGAFLNVGSDDAFAAITEALDRAAASLASSGSSTQPVVIEGSARSADAGGRLADLAGAGREGLGQDPDGC